MVAGQVALERRHCRAPPKQANGFAMELDLEGHLADRAYAILASQVTPRPIAFVTTISSHQFIQICEFKIFTPLKI